MGNALVYTLRGEAIDIVIAVEPGGAIGQLRYSPDDDEPREFASDAIASAVTPEGIRLTVVLEDGAADGPVVRFSALVPAVETWHEGPFDVTAAAVRTTQRSLFGGTRPGPQQGFEAMTLLGTAEMVSDFAEDDDEDSGSGPAQEYAAGESEGDGGDGEGLEEGGGDEDSDDGGDEDSDDGEDSDGGEDEDSDGGEEDSDEDDDSDEDEDEDDAGGDADTGDEDDDGEGDEDDADEGDADEGDADEGDADEGDADESDEDDADEDDADESDEDDADESDEDESDEDDADEDDADEDDADESEDRGGDDAEEDADDEDALVQYGVDSAGVAPDDGDEGDEGPDDAPPGSPHGGVAGESRDWHAVYDEEPPGPSKLIVTGTCMMATPGYRIELRPSEPQGINPYILLLDKVIIPPDGAQPDVVTDVAVRYEDATELQYDKVTIQPDGPTVDVIYAE